MNRLFNNDIQLLAAMLAPSMRDIFRDNARKMKSFIRPQTVDIFTDLEESMPKDVNTEGLKTILELKNINEDKDLILKAYDMACNADTTKLVYDSVRETLYQFFINSIQGDSIKLINAIKNNDIFFPDFGVMNSEYTRTLSFGNLAIRSDTLDLGMSFKSSFDFINSLTINGNGYYQDQVIVLSAPPGCFVGETKVMTLDGKYKTMRELNESGAKDIPVYSVDPNTGRIFITSAEECRVMGEHTKLIEITYDDGETSVCTPDHLFLTSDGTWIEAKDLVEGESLMPLHRVLDYHFRTKINHAVRSSKYEYVYTTDSRYMSPTHRICAEYKLGRPLVKGELVHHNLRLPDDSGYDSTNNLPENLIVLDSKEHKKYHMMTPEWKDKFLEAGKATRFTSERVSKFNIKNWNTKYEEMCEMTKRNFAKTVPVTIARNTGDKSLTKKQGVMKFLRGLIDNHIISGPQDLNKELYTKEREKFQYSCKRTPSWKSAMYYWDNNVAQMYTDALNWKNHSVKSVREVTFDEPVKVYDMINAGPYNNFAIMTNENDNSGIFVHNCGKSLFCMNEAIAACSQGLHVHYTALGDLTEFDFISRPTSILMNKPMMDVMKDLPKNYADVLSKNPYMNNLTIDFCSPGVFTVNEWIDMLKHSGELEKNDVFIVDYDTNFRSDKESIYLKGDEIYTALVLLAKTYHKIVIAVAQPKQQTWGKQMDLTALSESSRKQQHVDIMITLAPQFDVANTGNSIGELSVVKNRRGSTGRTKYFREPTGKFSEISRALFVAAQSSLDLMYYQPFEGCEMDSHYIRLVAPDIIDDINALNKSKNEDE